MGQVRVGGSGQWVFCGLFLLMIFAVPVIQVLHERHQDEPIQELEVFSGPPSREGFEKYERALERNSVVAEAVRRQVQWAMLHGLNEGNEKCIAGYGGMLYYRPSVDAVLAPSFMDGPAQEGDPLPAIIAFRDSLAARGARLILLIVPGKESVEPEGLAPSYPDEWGPPRNPGMTDFLNSLRAEGVELVDACEVLWAARGEDPVYLRQDTHWTPEGMGLVADAVAERVGEGLAGDHHYDPQPVRVESHGDLYDMLDLPPYKSRLTEQTVTIQRVIDPATGDPVEPDTSSPIVLLGDSFTNVYSAGPMGWGDHGGLGEQLALRMRRPVDLIAKNDGGVNTARIALARRRDPLAEKAVVIWQFAERDLVVSRGDWEIIDIK